MCSVGDSDNFRARHVPNPFRDWLLGAIFNRKPEKSEQYDICLRAKIITVSGFIEDTISIRLAGIDAPEGPHFGRTEQKHYRESLAWLSQQLPLGSIVYCQLLRGDQYSRAVGLPLVACSDVTNAMLISTFLFTGRYGIRSATSSMGFSTRFEQMLVHQNASRWVGRSL